MTKGRFLWKKEWYSLCSAHQEFNADCNTCKSGRWVNTTGQAISIFIFNISPGFWRWWVNLRKCKNDKV